MLFYIEEAPTNNCFLLSGAFQMFAINRCNKNFKLERRFLSQDCVASSKCCETIVVKGGFGVTALSSRARLGQHLAQRIYFSL